MGLKPYDRKIGQIFNNIQYDVDFYQRDYKWNDELFYKPVSSLLRDMFYRFDLEKYNANQAITPESINKLEWYYLNSFMTNDINGKKYIVDGQQRLTTLTLVSLALYHLSNEKELEKHVIDTLKNSILGNTEFGKQFWMGFKGRDKVLDDILENNLSFQLKSNNISEKNIYSNYKIIYNILSKKLETSHKLQTFISYFRNRIFMIEIEVDKNKDVAMVFEVINDRGIPLKPYEIIKGKLLSQIDINDRENFINIWEEQIRKLEEWGENEIDEFFGFYFRSKYADNAEQYKKLEKSRYHKTIFTEEFDVRIDIKDNESNVRKFVKAELPYFVDVYMEMLNYYETYSSEYESIYFNRLNDMDGQFLLVLSSIELNDTDKDLKIRRIPEFYDKISVLSRLSGSYKGTEFNANTIVLNYKIREKEIEQIKLIFDEQFKGIVEKAHDRNDLSNHFRYEFFKNIGYNHFGKRFLRYFFARVDHFISDFSGLDPFSSYEKLVLRNNQFKDTYHIEHILANNEENIKLFDDEEEFNYQRNRLGDLVLLKGRDNQSSGNESYENKLKTYNVVGTYYAKTLLEDMYHKKVDFIAFIEKNELNFKPYNNFSKDEIEDRQRLLFELAKIIWKN